MANRGGGRTTNPAYPGVEFEVVGGGGPLGSIGGALRQGQGAEAGLGYGSYGGFSGAGGGYSSASAASPFRQGRTAPYKKFAGGSGAWATRQGVKMPALGGQPSATTGGPTSQQAAILQGMKRAASERLR